MRIAFGSCLRGLAASAQRRESCEPVFGHSPLPTSDGSVPRSAENRTEAIRRPVMPLRTCTVACDPSPPTVPSMYAASRSVAAISRNWSALSTGRSDVVTCSPRVRSVLTTTCWTRAAPSPVNPKTATLPLTLGPSDFPLDFPPALAAAGRDAGAAAAGGGGGDGGGVAFAGSRTLACLAFVQLDSEGLARATPAESGMTHTARADRTSRSDGRTKTAMITEPAVGLRLRRGCEQGLRKLPRRAEGLGAGRAPAL